MLMMLSSQACTRGLFRSPACKSIMSNGQASKPNRVDDAGVVAGLRRGARTTAPASSTQLGVRLVYLHTDTNMHIAHAGAFDTHIQLQIIYIHTYTYTYTHTFTIYLYI